MTISGVSSATSTTAPDTSNRLAALQAQEAKIDTKITDITNDKTLDAKTKAAEVAAYEAEKAQIQAQIDRIKEQKAQAQQPKTEETAPAAKLHSGFYVVA